MRSTSRFLKQLRGKKITEKERNTIRRLECYSSCLLGMVLSLKLFANHLYSQVLRAFIFNALVLILKIIFTQRISMDIFD